MAAPNPLESVVDLVLCQHCEAENLASRYRCIACGRGLGRIPRCGRREVRALSVDQPRVGLLPAQIVPGNIVLLRVVASSACFNTHYVRIMEVLESGHPGDCDHVYEAIPPQALCLRFPGKNHRDDVWLCHTDRRLFCPSDLVVSPSLDWSGQADEADWLQLETQQAQRQAARECTLVLFLCSLFAADLL